MIRDLPGGERPRERLRDAGAAALSNTELLAILLRTGTPVENVLDLSTRILAHFNGLAGLARATHPDLCSLYGFGDAKSAQLLAAIELGRRLQVANSPDRLAISSPEDVANIVSGDMADFDQEHFRVLVLDTKNHVLASPDVFVGSVNSTSIRTAEVSREAVRRNSPGIILVHNHPSGDPEPSAEDASVTREIVAAGKALDIEVLDHVVIGRNGFVSLKERGLGFG
ncbi:MAG: DNA repair protein RadC [Chloroflexi bacterium]|nr:DNA repair protein RadC [Chloroflexota bacterium]